MGVSETSDHIKIMIKMPNPSQAPPKTHMRPLRTLMIFAPSISRQRAKIWTMDIPKTSDHIQIMIKMPNSSQEPPASFKAQNEDLKDMDVLCTFKIQIESPNLDHGCIKYQRLVTINKSRSRCQSPVRDLQCPLKPQIRT